MTPDATDTRTIRISGETYKQLAMLAGYWSAIKGETQSVSELADVILSNHCDKMNAQFLEIFANPTALKRLQDAAKVELNRISELLKLMKIKE